jgi:hypothetical protein
LVPETLHVEAPDGAHTGARVAACAGPGEAPEAPV